MRQQRRGRKTRRKKGDKSKNGRSATLVVIYTLRRRQDGRLHARSIRRYVVTERLDNSGMRWIEERPEAVLLLRWIEVNGDWEDLMR